MRTLVIGAGAVGGYFGGRLAQAGRDVTFLVRPRRAALLRANGLNIKSPLGDFHLADPQLATQESLREPYDLILLSCKAYDLDSAMNSFADAIGAQTAILPLLNGMAHIDALSARFGAEKVLGGLCMISATLKGDGAIAHLNKQHGLTFGELDGVRSPRVGAVAKLFEGVGFDARESAAIRQDMWDKWIFIAGLAGITVLMRAAIGDIVAAGAADLAMGLFDECAAIAAANGFTPSADHVERTRKALTEPGSLMTASMLRDIEAGAPIEAGHILGDLLRRAGGEAERTLAAAQSLLPMPEPMRRAACAKRSPRLRDPKTFRSLCCCHEEEREMSKNVLKSVLITGASSGIGATYAERFARRGHDLVLVARNGDRMRATAEQLRATHGVSVDILPADLTVPDELERIAARLRNDARIGILINNAGAVLPGGFLDFDSAAQDWLLRLNVAAPTRLAHAFIPRVLSDGGGAIVNIASVLALAPEIMPGIYAATKSYMLTFSQSLQAEFGPRGLYVQAVLPATTRTEIWERSGRSVEFDSRRHGRRGTRRRRADRLRPQGGRDHSAAAGNQPMGRFRPCADGDAAEFQAGTSGGALPPVTARFCAPEWRANMCDFPFRTALIVGAGAGISASLARAFAALGVQVALAARNTDKLAALCAETGAVAFSADASDSQSVAALFDAVEARFGAPDIVIYNAGARLRGGIAELDPAMVEKALAIGAFGGFLVAQQAARRMVPRGHGAILFTGATASVKGFALSGGFAMSKFALRGLAQSAARELGPKGVHVAHFVIDGGVRAAGRPDPAGKPDSFLDPDAIAQAYIDVLRQQRSAWSFEVELRPWVETF